MKKIFLSILLLASQSFAAVEEVQLSNKIRFFRQDISIPTSLPVPLQELQPLVVQFAIDSETPFELQKMYSTQIFVQDLKAVVEIYYFRRHATQEKYYSLQVHISKNSRLISRCTSYFALEQKFLVPGVCSGVDPQDGQLYGISIYR